VQIDETKYFLAQIMFMPWTGQWSEW